MILSNPADTLKVVDSLKNSGEEGGGWILHHVMDSNYIDFDPFGKLYLPHLELFGIDISITKNVFFMWILALVLIILLYSLSKRYKASLIPKGLTNFFEIMVLFVRDEIVRPTIGAGYEKFLPYLLTLFFFVLFGNLFGLIPYSTSITGNIAVTAALAGISFLATQYGGIQKHGFFKYFTGLIPTGMPIAILPLIIVVEIIGLFTKPFSLCIRLFANMIAGHVVIFSLIGLIFILKTVFVSPVSVGFALFIYLLELLVALIQAYIFTMLTALYIGMAVHQEH
jgi:F-type H+-transporting ATPase subunit a